MNESLSAIRRGSNSLIYEIGIVHTTMRDIAMSASWKLLGVPNFSRDSPFTLPITCPLSRDVYEATMLARHKSIRGAVEEVDAEAIANHVLSAPLYRWVTNIKDLL